MKKIQDLIEKFEGDAIAIREFLHQHPELSNQEHNTTAFIEKKLQEYGIEVLDFGLKTGVIAILNREKSNTLLAIRSDIDALPLTEQTALDFQSVNEGVSHSCGHDIHMSALLLAARVLAEIKDDLKGSVLFIFQPAEENMMGADEVLHSGVFKQYKPDMILAEHTWPFLEAGKIGLLKKEFMASSDFIKLKILGRGGHGAHPEDCIDPVSISAYIITALQSIVSRNIAPLDSAVLTIGKILGGTAANIIPHEVVLEGTLRTVNNKTRSYIIEKIRTISTSIAQSMGGDCEVEIVDGCPALENTESIVSELASAGEEILESENVVYLDKPSMGSEDFAKYLKEIPGAMFRVGTFNEDPRSKLGLHNPGIIFDNRAVLTGAKTMAAFAYNYLKNS